MGTCEWDAAPEPQGSEVRFGDLPRNQARATGKLSSALDTYTPKSYVVKKQCQSSLFHGNDFAVKTVVSPGHILHIPSSGKFCTEQRHFMDRQDIRAERGWKSQIV